MIRHRLSPVWVAGEDPRRETCRQLQMTVKAAPQKGKYLDMIRISAVVLWSTTVGYLSSLSRTHVFLKRPLQANAPSASLNRQVAGAMHKFSWIFRNPSARLLGLLAGSVSVRMCKACPPSPSAAIQKSCRRRARTAKADMHVCE